MKSFVNWVNAPIELPKGVWLAVSLSVFIQFAFAVIGAF